MEIDSGVDRRLPLLYGAMSVIMVKIALDPKSRN